MTLGVSARRRAGGAGGGTVLPLAVPRSTALTLLATVKTHAVIAGSADDAYLTSLINEVSETIYATVGRPLYRNQWRERNYGSTWAEYVLRNRPIAALDSVTFLGDAQTNVEVSIPDAGILFRDTGFDTDNQPDEWSFTYTAGYWLPGDDYSGSVSVAASDRSYNSAAADFPTLLRPNDTITWAGFANAANNGLKIIETATASKITVTSAFAPVDEGAASVSGGIRNLPGWIERIAIEMIGLIYQSRDRDPSLRSVTVGPTRFEWNQSAQASALLSRLDALAVPV